MFSKYVIHGGSYVLKILPIQIVASIELNKIYLRDIEESDNDDQLITDLIFLKKITFIYLYICVRGQKCHSTLLNMPVLILMKNFLERCIYLSCINVYLQVYLCTMCMPGTRGGQ